MSDVIVIATDAALVLSDGVPSIVEIPGQTQTLVTTNAPIEILELPSSVTVLDATAPVQVLDVPPVITILEEGIQGLPGPAGPVGPAGSADIVCSTNVDLSGHKIVILDDAGFAQYASANNSAHMGRVLGMTLGASAAGAQTAVRSVGPITEPSWTWTQDLPIYLGLNGALTQVRPAQPNAVFQRIVAMALSPTTALLTAREPILLS